jgi:hypothetical protein
MGLFVVYIDSGSTRPAAVLPVAANGYLAPV